MKRIFVLLLVLTGSSTWAQQPVSYRFKVGEEITSMLKFTEFHRYPSFTKGTVYFYDGTATDGMLNYNFLIDEMQFLRGNDTLSLADEPTVKYIAIGKDTFLFHNKGYLRQLATYDNKTLAVKEVLRILSVENMGAYGLPVAAGSVDNIISINDRKFTVNQDVILALRISWWVGERKSFYPANRKNVLKVFDKSPKEAGDYLDKVNFEKQDDLVQMFNRLSKGE